MNSVLCVGHANWDTVLHTDTVPEPDFSSEVVSEHSAPGGSATNTALALAALDVDVGLAACVGSDDEANKIDNVLANAGVGPHLVRTDDRTTRIRCLITGDDDPRYFHKHTGLTYFGPHNISKRAHNADHVHVTNFDKEVGTTFARWAKTKGKTVSFNPTQGFEEEAVPVIVDAADLIIVNDREREILEDRYDIEHIMDDSVLVVTHGADGSDVYAEYSHSHSGVEVDEVEDTIGAGDAYVAGFLSVWSGDGTNYDEALNMASACGAYAVTQVGAPDSFTSADVYNVVN